MWTKPVPLCLLHQQIPSLRNANYTCSTFTISSTSCSDINLTFSSILTFTISSDINLTFSTITFTISSAHCRDTIYSSFTISYRDMNYTSFTISCNGFRDVKFSYSIPNFTIPYQLQTQELPLLLHLYLHPLHLLLQLHLLINVANSFWRMFETLLSLSLLNFCKVRKCMQKLLYALK